MGKFLISLLILFQDSSALSAERRPIPSFDLILGTIKGGKQGVCRIEFRSGANIGDDIDYILVSEDRSTTPAKIIEQSKGSLSYQFALDLYNVVPIIATAIDDTTIVAIEAKRAIINVISIIRWVRGPNRILAKTT